MISNETAERPDYFVSHFIFCDPGRRLRRLVGICIAVSENFRNKSFLTDAAKAFPCIGLYRFDRRLTAGIFVFLFRKKLPFFQLRTAAAGIMTTLVLIRAMEWANESDFPSILAFLSPLSMRYLFISQSRAHWTDVHFSFILTCMLCGILLSVLIVRKQVHWSWTAVRMTILANVFAIGTIHGGMLTLYPYVLEVLIEILIAEQIIQGIQRWIEK